MFSTRIGISAFLLLVSVATFFGGPLATAQGPLDSETFLYQGVLRQNGELISGLRDLQFHLYDSNDPALVSALAFTATDGVTINNGIVNIKLSFPTGVFDGSSRWLEVWVKDPAEVSASVAFNSAGVQLKVVSSSPVLVDKLVPCVITGASSTALTVTVTVTVSVRAPSDTCTTKPLEV